MQRHARAADLLHQRFATRENFVQVRRTKWLLSRAWENDVTHLQIVNWPIVGCCKRVQFFCNAQRRLADFVIGTYVSDDGWIDRIAKNHQRIIAHFNCLGAMGERSRYHDEWIGRADQETKLF